MRILGFYNSLFMNPQRLIAFYSRKRYTEAFFTLSQRNMVGYISSLKDKTIPFLEILKLKASPIDVFVILATCSTIGSIDFKILPAILSGVLIHSGGDILNDIYDREIDKICKPDAVIPSGRMSVRTAWTYLIALTLAALLIAVILSRIMFIAYLIGIASGYILYSHPRFRFKDVPPAWTGVCSDIFSIRSHRSFEYLCPNKHGGHRVLGVHFLADILPHLPQGF
jgi:hypothetical protein